MTKLSLRQKINGAVLFTSIVISFIFISVQILLQNHRNDTVSNELAMLLQMVVEREHDAIANEIFQGLDKALTLRLDHILEMGSILSISIFNDSGQLLVFRGENSEPEPLFEKQKDALSMGSTIFNGKYQGQFSLVYMQRIEIIGEIIGYIRICYSLETRKQEQQESVIILSALLGSILIVMLILMNLILSRTIVRPILSLSEKMGRIQADKFERHVYPKNQDEIGTLSAAFNKMAKELTTSYREVDLKRNQLQTAEKYLSNIINSMPSVLLGVDETLKVTKWNHRAEEITKIAPEAAVGKPLLEVFPLLKTSLEIIVQALHERTVQKMENVSWDINNSTFFMDITVYPLNTNATKGAVIRIDDITDRRLTQEALYESQEKYRLVVENANDAILVIQDGIIKFANCRAEELSGFSLDGMKTWSFIDCVAKEDRYLVRKNYAARIQGQPVPQNYSFRIIDKSGNRLWVHTSSVLISWNNRPAILNFLRNITDQKNAEEQLLHAQKMEAIGTLTGGIAHDFNNLLQVIQGYSQLLLFRNKNREDMQSELESILNATQKGGELTKQLLTFSRKTESLLKPVDINVQIQKAQKILSRTIPKMIDIELQLQQDLPIVLLDSGQIEQVVLNLVINARDAMPEGGRILIETESVHINKNSSAVHHVQSPRRYIRLSISDTGHGISGEDLDHIFEPFFTTKKPGEGTGLGLSMVYGIVKSHKGSIQCHSIPGHGTTFKIYFPADIAIKEQPQITKTRQTSDIAGGNECILLVDDEDSIRDIGRQLLERFGYTIFTASNGMEALKIYSQYRTRIDLVILDLIMPGMGGEKCLDSLLKLNPGIKVIIASGYYVSSEEDTDSNKRLDMAKGTIQKPFVLEDILNEVRRVLDTDC